MLPRVASARPGQLTCQHKRLAREIRWDRDALGPRRRDCRIHQRHHLVRCRPRGRSRLDRLVLGHRHQSFPFGPTLSHCAPIVSCGVERSLAPGTRLAFESRSCPASPTYPRSPISRPREPSRLRPRPLPIRVLRSNSTYGACWRILGRLARPRRRPHQVLPRFPGVARARPDFLTVACEKPAWWGRHDGYSCRISPSRNWRLSVPTIRSIRKA